MVTSLPISPKVSINSRHLLARWGAGLFLLSGILLPVRPATAQTELSSHVTSEAGASVSLGSTQLLFSAGQAVTGSSASGTADLSIGFIHDLSALNVEVSSPVPMNPPFAMVGRSSLTVSWLANDNPVGTLYEARLSTAADFSTVLGSSQTYNLDATFSGLNPNTLYFARAAAYSTIVSSWSAFASVGSTYTLATTPGQPIGISTFSAPTDSGFTLNWSSGSLDGLFNSAGTIYLAQISTLSSFTSVWASSQTANLYACFSGLNQYTPYYARIQASNDNNIVTTFEVIGSTFVGPPLVYPGIVNIVAGKGTSSSSGTFSGDGGPATNAELYFPKGLSADARGNVYVADTSNNRIRKVDTNGIITTVAGNGTAGYSVDGVSATVVQLNHPQDVAVDADQNIYIADTSNCRLRKVDRYGIITTIAGNGTSGYLGDGDLAVNAELYSPYRVILDDNSNIYIRDGGRIRKIDKSGIISTVFSGMSLNDTWGFARDNNGNNYYLESGVNKPNRVIKVDVSGSTVAVAGTDTNGYYGDGGPATSAQFETPLALAADIGGNIFVADTMNNRIRRVDNTGIINTVAGNGSFFSYSGDGGLATDASIFRSRAMAVGEFGTFYVTDDYSRIREVSVASSPPPTPTLNGVVLSPTLIQWSWNKLGRTAAYKLQTSTAGVVSGVLSSRTSYFVEIGLSTNTLYSRELIAINSAGTSTTSVVSAYTRADVPTELAFGNISTSTVFLTWNAVTNPSTTTFEVSYTTSSNFSVGSDISTAPAITSTFTTVTGLAGQTTYYFRLRAYNGDGLATGFSSIASTSTAILQSSVTAMIPSTGTIGVAFTLTGEGFGTQDGENTRVRFGVGGSTAPITSWSDTTISGIVPLVSSGAYAVAVERQGSILTTASAGTFTVVTPNISSITASFGFASFDLAGTGFGEYVDSSTTKVTFDGSSVELFTSSWTDTLVRVVPDAIDVGTYTVLVVLSYSVGTVQSNAVTFVVTPGMKGLSLAASSAHRVVMPPLYYQANLRLRPASGGRVTAPSRASVTIPPKALATNTSVSLKRGASTGPDKEARDKARTTSALGDMGEAIEFGPDGTKFAVPVTIELPYDQHSVPMGRESALAIHYWDRAIGAWTALLTEVDMIHHRLRAQTDHFSLYQPLITGFYPAAAASAEFRLVDVYAFPNPSRRGHVAIIRSQVGLADEVEVRIYDISGRLVNSGSTSAWKILDDGNGKGSQYTYDYTWDTGGVGSDIYLYAISAKKAGAASIRKTGKIGVIK